MSVRSGASTAHTSIRARCSRHCQQRRRGCCKAQVRTRALSQSAMASPSRSRSSRTTTHQRWSRTKVPRPAWVEFFGMCSRWARVRSRCSIHYGSVRLAAIACVGCLRALSAASATTATVSACRPLAAKWFSIRRTKAIRWSTRCALGSCAKTNSFALSHRALAIRSWRSVRARVAMEFTAHRLPVKICLPKVKRSARWYRSATPSLKSCCSKRPSNSFAAAPSSPFRTWARRVLRRRPPRWPSAVMLASRSM